MTGLTPEETLRHIYYKASVNELAPDLAHAMITLFELDPTLDYAALRAAALRRQMPEVVFHTSSLRNRTSIASHGLLAADPAEGHYGFSIPLGQPIGVYASAEPDERGVWAINEPVWGIWSITGAAALPHRQDPLNPEHFVIECDVPRDMVRFCGTASLDPRHNRLDLPIATSSSA